MANISDYYERTIALLASQFQIKKLDGTRTNLQKIIYVFCQQMQELQTQLNLLQTMRYLNTAQGVQLDGLGEILGLPRIIGQSDEDYREDLQFQIFINKSNGTPEEVLQILKYLTEANKTWYWEVYPAAYQMATDGLNFTIPPSDIARAIQRVSPAGVKFIGVTAIYNTVPFVFSSDPINEQFYVNPNPDDPLEYDPFQVNPGTGLENFGINRGQTVDPDFGGGFAEALGTYPNYTIDTTGAGQLAEFIGPEN